MENIEPILEHVVPIVAICCAALVLIIWLVFSSIVKMRRSNPAKSDPQLLSRIAALEEIIKTNLERRVSNVESILTDREYSLSKKISDLK